MPRFSRLSLPRLLLVVAALGVLSCSDRPPVAPAAGKVLYNGEPLPFGSIVFQPGSGQSAAGRIEADGSFRLSTFAPNDGAPVGSHRVKVTCYASQHPAYQLASKGGEQSLGRQLIPKRYFFFEGSGLTAEVPPSGAEELFFELTGPRVDFKNP